MLLPVTLIQGDKISDKTDYRDNLPVNMYAVSRKILGADGYMLQFPGLNAWKTGYGIDRGAIYNEHDRMQYRISGTKFISVAENGTVTNLGTVPGTRQGRLIDCYSFNTQAIIADGNMFLYSPAGGFNQVVDADLGNPIDGVYINGYYFLTDGDYLYHTDIDDETSIDPLKFATAEFMPDPIKGVGKTKDNKAIAFGRFTIEYFSDEANADFAFTRIETRAQKIGIVATHAKCSIGDAWFIVGSAREEALSVHMLQSGISKDIATREIQQILATYNEDELSDIRLEAIQDKDTKLVLCHLPNETLYYNINLSTWGILKTDTIGDSPYRGINGVYDARNGKWVFGDSEDNNIGYLDDSLTTHFNLDAEWMLYSPFVYMETYSIDELSIETLPGHNTVDDARVAISLTYNGVSYGTEVWNDYGDPSDYNQRFLFRRLGQIDEWVGFKFRGISDSRMAFALMKVEYS